MLTLNGQPLRSSYRSIRRPTGVQLGHPGYPKLKPAIPFPYEDVVRNASPFRQNNHFDTFIDPYLLEGSEAVAAVRRAAHHGQFFFHDIPHIESLLANQDLRLKNNLEPHRIGSIRHNWPYNRP
ncbi:unnamed protein product, partial [Iphiclides podalirius]